MKYGVQSHSAFSRAFKEHHGITPAEAKLDSAKLYNYLPINFSEMRFIGGKRIMSEMKKIIYKEADERLMVGMQRETSFYEAGNVWQEFFRGSELVKLNMLADVKCCDDIDANDGIGLMYDFEDMYNFKIIIGDFVQTGAQIPEGLYISVSLKA